MQLDVSWQFRLVRLGSITRQFRLMQAELRSDGRSDERLVSAHDKKFLIGVVTVRNMQKKQGSSTRSDRTTSACAYDDQKHQDRSKEAQDTNPRGDTGGRATKQRNT